MTLFCFGRAMVTKSIQADGPGGGGGAGYYGSEHYGVPRSFRQQHSEYEPPQQNPSQSSYYDRQRPPMDLYDRGGGGQHQMGRGHMGSRFPQASN